MDTYYISHGSPKMSIDEANKARHFLQKWRHNGFPQSPRAILVISGHWDTDVPSLNVVQHNDTIYDFNNMPKAMYQIKYPAPGAPELAKRVKELLVAGGFDRVDEDKNRGLDHGAWTPLMFMYPEADIPICQLSVQSNKDGTYHYNLGKAIAPLKEEGVLIMGSGSAVHNLRALKFGTTKVEPWALEFDTWLKEALLEGRYEDVNQWDKKAPHPKMAHPFPDHFYPLHVAMGAAGADAKAKLIHQSWEAETLSYSSYQFTSP